jgi:hypothetical protein
MGQMNIFDDCTYMRKILAYVLGILGRKRTAASTKRLNKNFYESTEGIMPMKISGEDAWNGDVNLSIVSSIETEYAKIYTAISSWKGRNLGLMVSIPKKTGEKGFGTEFQLKSIGEESDYLLHTISKTWRQKLKSSSRWKPELSLTYVDLNEFGKTIGQKENPNNPWVRYKLFFEGSRDEDYAELYINVNNIERAIVIMEKDLGYRTPLCHWLTA